MPFESGKNYLKLVPIAVIVATFSLFAPMTFLPNAVYAHVDPANCTGPSITQSLRVYRPGPDGTFGTVDDIAVTSSGALVDGESVAFETTLSSNNCAIDAGSLIIVDPSGVVNDVAPDGVPCLGGTTPVGDTIGPADCNPAVQSFTSDRTLAQYTVDCDDVNAGRLRFSAVWNGLMHNEPDDADAAPQDNTRNDSRHCASTSLTKTASAEGIAEASSITVPAGTTVTFTYRETNDGTTALFGVSVADPDCAPITRQPDAPGNNDAVLNPGETWVFTCDVVVTGTFTNTATASGTTSASTGSRVVTNPPDTDESASATVNVDSLSIDLTKECTPTASVGDTVTYTFTIDNNGASALEHVALTDSLLGPVTIPPAGSITGDTDNDGILDTDETWTVTATRTVQAGDPDPLVNTATVTADVVGPSTTQVSDTDDCSTDLTSPGTTRTPGYWKTHLAQSTDVWADVVASGNQIQCGGFNVDTTAKMMGGFWSSNTRETDGDRRTSLDQARIHLAFHLEAAILNNQAFGSSPDAFGTSLADAKAAFCGNSRSAMLSATADLDAFNNSGDKLPFPPGFVNSTATPIQAHAAANKAYWNQPNLPGPP